MDYVIRVQEPVSAEVRRIVAALARDGVDHVDGDLDDHETVHEVRKRCKEARATLRLVRGVLPTYSEENAHYRDTARILSATRDATALIEAFDDHVRPTVEADGAVDSGTLDECRAALVDRRASTGRARRSLRPRLRCRRRSTCGLTPSVGTNS